MIKDLIMQPIHELIKRIQWDSDFGKGDFELGFYDRIDEKIIRIPFRDIHFLPSNHDLFYFIDNEGQEHSIPFHRIKAVYKNGERIWERKY